MLTTPLRKQLEFPRTSAWEQPEVSAPSERPAHDPKFGPDAGVNIFAYFKGQFGLGEGARLYTKALMERGYPVALYDIDLAIPHGMDDMTLDARLGIDTPYQVHLIFVNPDYFHAAIEKIGRAKIERGYVIACWFWELENIPAEWVKTLDEVDEIIVSSAFVEGMFRKVTKKPVTRIALPLFEMESSQLQREDFGLREDAFLFLLTFDFNSSLDRKNPMAAIEAFKLAFPAARNDVQLLIKSSNGHRYPHKLLQLLSVADSDPRIIVRDEIIDSSHLRSLQMCADAYMSLHRAEGFGLGIAESMMIGKPVVATAWSGNTDFMDESNSCPVGYELISVSPGQYLHWENQRWAEADTTQAAYHMRRLVDEPGLANLIGAKASIDIRKKLSPSLAAKLLIDRFESRNQKRSPHDQDEGTGTVA